MNNYEYVRYIQGLLINDKEWKKRFEDYAVQIKRNIDKITKSKRQFNVRDPLFLYINISKAKGKSPEFSLRYHGQILASLSIKGNDVTISTKGYDKNNYFNCPEKLLNENWDSDKARKFRTYYLTNPPRNENLPKKIRKNEHRIESLLLTKFSKKSSLGKDIKYIKPVKLAGIARFQMPTPLAASKGNVKYSLQGGGIDILARVGSGPNTKLCVMEIKDEKKDDPINAIKQGLAYTVFIRELLRSDSGQLWWELYGFKPPVPKKLKLYTACVMPIPDNISDNVKPFDIDPINFNDSEDSIHFHYILFEPKNDEISIQKSSFNKSKPR
jgi:hypothetical protein